MSISVEIHHRIVHAGFVDGYHCFDRTRHTSKNRDLNLKFKTALVLPVPFFCKAHFVTLKIFTQETVSLRNHNQEIANLILFFSEMPKNILAKRVSLVAPKPKVPTVAIPLAEANGWHLPVINFGGVG